ncbi:hypothetical protein ACVWU4_000919 [Campylobacter coli]
MSDSGNYFGCKITTTGQLQNTNPNHYSKNPHETNTFIHPIMHVEDEAFVEHIEWILEGEVPLDLVIEEIDNNPNNVRLYGYIHPFIDQPLLQHRMPKREKIKFSGENYRCLKLLDHTVTLNMTIKRRYLYKPPMISGSDGSSGNTGINRAINNGVENQAIEKIASSNISITFIRNEDVFNRVFVEKYLDASSTTIKLANGREFTNIHRFIRGNKTYTYKNFKQFIKDAGLP